MNMKFKSLQIILATITLIFGISPIMVKAESPISAIVTVEEKQRTVGDPINLIVTVTHPEDYYVIPPNFSNDWGEFTVHSQSQPETTINNDGTSTTTLRLDVRLFMPGAYNTPPLVFSVSDSAGQLHETVADSISISISSILTEGDTQLRDIKPQAELPYNNYLSWLIAAIFAFAVIGIFVYLLKRRRALIETEPDDNRLPYEKANDDLDYIESLGLPENGKFKEYYTLVSDTIRIYIERTFNIPVMERTTSEIQHGLRKTDTSLKTTQVFLDFLNDSDLVKFSKFTPDLESSNLLMDQARSIIDMTKYLHIQEHDQNDIHFSQEEHSPKSTNQTNPHVEVIA